MERNAFFDNAKVFLIFLVVFGHMIQPFISDSQSTEAIYIWIYTFHMPAFILLAGFFAKGSGNKKYIWNLTKKLIVPYFIFQTLYTIYYFFIGKADWQTGVFYPQWSLWFLFSLFSWHILLVLFKKIPAGWSITLSILIGIVVGYFGEIGHSFSLSRTFVFFPFFLIGYWLTVDQMMLVKHRKVKIASIAVMASMFVLIYVFPVIDTGWLLASKSYSNLGVESFGGFVRLFVYAIAAVMTISILAWIPKRNLGWVTVLGTRTLYVYLLHGFIVQFLREFDLLSVHHWFDVVGIAGLSALIVISLSSKPILTISQPLIEGRLAKVKSLFNRRHKGTSS
ncbi:acyltransferase family protein [Oceanobacillus oncorhynchi]|uniref:acyltransferase family protein n=1 Tax=Oceanobacillus oncorhynchi TaxID=545501 RepID=UPI0021164210|nr:acyltransferase family protein [Oceanobacillus oncorhynchi]UUI39670.1 acyltransferase family protein [Oceanobacillus oncorhynchi]